MNKSLIIWVPAYSSFDTMKFENVTDVHDNNKFLEFTYDGVSTKTKRHACFDKSRIIGYAESVEVPDARNN